MLVAGSTTDVGQSSGLSLSGRPIRITHVHMSTTLTIRTDEALRAALESRANALGRSVSDVAREILRNALEERPLRERTGHLRGGLQRAGSASDAWRRTLRERNWRS